MIVEDYTVSEMVIVNGWQCLPYDNCWVIVEDYMVSEMVIVNGWQCLPYGNCWVVVEVYAVLAGNAYLMVTAGY